MKKFLSLTLAATMVLSLGATALANDTTNTYNNGSNSPAYERDSKGLDENQALATYTLGKSYTVTIPDEINVGTETASATGMTVKAENVVIGINDTLTVTVSSTNGWAVNDKDDNTNTLAYKLNDGTSDITQNDTTILSVAAGENWNSETSKTLTATLTDTPKKSGTYTDTLTFSVGVTTPSDPAGE
jgi:hypothetical protein